MENCVLQCETTGVTVRTSAELVMKTSDLCGAKVCASRLSWGARLHPQHGVGVPQAGKRTRSRRPAP